MMVQSVHLRTVTGPLVAILMATQQTDELVIGAHPAPPSQLPASHGSVSAHFRLPGMVFGLIESGRRNRGKTDAVAHQTSESTSIA